MSYQPESGLQHAVRPTQADDVVVEPVVRAPSVHAVGATVVSPPRVEEVVVTEPAVVRHRQVATSYGQRFAIDSIIVGIIGLALMIVGLIAITRAGVDGPFNEPVVSVLGFTHTATLGAIEVVIGLCLLICAATTSKSGAIFFGLVLGVGGIVGAVQADSFRRSLALESGLAWLAVIAAAIVVLVSLLIPRLATHTTRVEAI
jgi:uncharacterized membrane protein HdeD (DUF308 family)